MVGRAIRKSASSGILIAVSVILGVFLLALTMTLAASMLGQSRDLERKAELTSDIINANVRTLGQFQRELLRMSVKLQDTTSTVDELELQRSFVTQRASEAQLSYQLQTLGTEELLAEARRLADEWNEQVSPRVAELIEVQRVDGIPVGDGAAQQAEIQEAVVQIRGIEFDVNQLVAHGEINRKSQAGEANTATIAILQNARRLVLGLAVTFVAGLALLIVALVSYRKFEQQRRASQRELETLHAEAQTLSEVASRTSNMVVITDARGHIEWINDAFVAMTGYHLDEIRGRRPGELLQGPDTDPDTIAFMRKRIRAGEGFTTNLVNYNRSGEPYWTAVEVRPVHDNAGVLTNFIAVQSDVTAAREAEEVLRKAKDAAVELAEDKAQFLASMSHEIRTPLNAVIGLTDLLLDTDLQPQQREYVQIAQNSGTLVLATISNILSFSASDSGNVELDTQPLSLRHVAERTVALLETQATEKGLSLAVAVDDQIPETVVGDEVRLQQILINLVGNAVKFTENGRIKVEVRPADEPSNDPSMCSVQIDVIDTGIGIAEDRLGRLFQPFSQVDPSITRRYGGSGLGLAISRQLVDLMGGEISVESRPGYGSRFSFVLNMPIAKTPHRQQPTAGIAAEAAEVDETNLHVLLVEDDEINQTVAKHMLARLGHAVTVANDGIEAVDAMQVTLFDVVLMDIQMPRMDGLSATKKIRALLPAHRQPPIIALTANALDGDRERFLAAGMDEYLSKPFRRNELAQAITRVLPIGEARRAAGSVPSA